MIETAPPGLTRQVRPRARLMAIVCLLALAPAAQAGEFVPGEPPRLPDDAARQAQAAALAVQSARTVGGAPLVYLPLVQRDAGGLAVNPQSRQASRDFYLQQYLASEEVAHDWTGQQATCDPGTTDPAFRDAVLRRINYFRAMAGVPAGVTFSAESNRLAQAAALMMSANGQLSHSPPPTWTCYSADGSQGAGSSNLYLGVYGWQAISGYIKDAGDNNYPAGHRRWILYPQTQIMGTGDIPPTQNYWPANALRVFDAHMWEPRPATREEFVAWPPPGYVPYQVVYPRWSFSYAQANFSGATVSMTSNGGGVAVSQAPVVNGYGENTLVWIPLGMHHGGTWPNPGADTAYTVHIQNAVVDGFSRDFTYTVIVFDPMP